MFIGNVRDGDLRSLSLSLSLSNSLSPSGRPMEEGDKRDGGIKIKRMERKVREEERERERERKSDIESDRVRERE